jgi:hypothetical protein
MISMRKMREKIWHNDDASCTIVCPYDVGSMNEILSILGMMILKLKINEQNILIVTKYCAKEINKNISKCQYLELLSIQQ